MSGPRPAPPPSVLALIPAHDEGPRIGGVVRETREWLPVLVVDDGSTDDTADRAATAGATVIRQRPNAGKGAALRAGFRWALERDHPAVVTLDADGQHDPAEIPRFLAAWDARHPDLVIGRRDFRRMPPTRRLANTLGGLVFSWAVGQPVPDNQSGYRLVGAGLLPRLLDSEEPGFGFEVEMIALAIRAGSSIEWLPIRTIYAGGPSHIRPSTHLRAFVRATRVARRIVRARG